MNLDEYRELISQEEAGADAQAEQSTVTTVEPVVQETPQAEPVPVEVGTEETAQVEPVQAEPTIDPRVEELQAQLQQAQQHLQQATEAKLWYDKIQENPEYAKAFAADKGLTYIDPEARAVKELESKYQTLLVEKEVQALSIKYKDFDPQEVIPFAVQRGLGNLEDAYILNNSLKGGNDSVKDTDITSIKEQIRQEILNELQSNVSTTSMIGSGVGSATVQPAQVELTPAEIKVAQAFGLSPAEYDKMKNVN